MIQSEYLHNDISLMNSLAVQRISILGNKVSDRNNKYK